MTHVYNIVQANSSGAPHISHFICHVGQIWVFHILQEHFYYLLQNIPRIQKCSSPAASRHINYDSA